MELFLSHIDNFRNCFIVKDNVIKKCEDQRSNRTYDGSCGILDDKIIGYFVKNNKLYIINNGIFFEVNPKSVSCEHKKIDKGYNLHIVNNGVEIINLDYIPFEDNLYYNDEDPNIAQKLEGVLSSEERINATIHLYENYGQNYVRK